MLLFLRSAVHPSTEFACVIECHCCNICSYLLAVAIFMEQPWWSLNLHPPEPDLPNYESGCLGTAHIAHHFTFFRLISIEPCCRIFPVLISCVYIWVLLWDAGEGNAAQGGVISPRSSSSSSAPIAQSLKGLFQRQSHPPATLPTGGLLSSRRNSSELQTSTPGACPSNQYWITVSGIAWSGFAAAHCKEANQQACWFALLCFLVGWLPCAPCSSLHLCRGLTLYHQPFNQCCMHKVLQAVHGLPPLFY